MQAGERIGNLIKFGSTHVDVILGPEWAIEVSVTGARVSAGSSILARRGGEVELPLRDAGGAEGTGALSNINDTGIEHPAAGLPVRKTSAARGLRAAHDVHGGQYHHCLSVHGAQETGRGALRIAAAYPRPAGF